LSTNYDEIFVTCNSRLDFGGDPDHNADTGIFKAFYLAGYGTSKN